MRQLSDEDLEAIMTLVENIRKLSMDVKPYAKGEVIRRYVDMIATIMKGEER